MKYQLVLLLISQEQRLSPYRMQRFIILIKKIRNIQITYSNDFVKILGIYFTSNLQKTSAWELCISNLEKQLQQLSRRHLSLRGKAILLNTFILSKVTFLSKIFVTLTQIQKQIETNIFEHIWQFSKKEPIERKALFLPKTQGGIGLIEPKCHSLAIKLKNFFILKEEDY